MDALQAALQDENMTIEYPSNEEPKIILFGKSEMSRRYEEGELVVSEPYCISRIVDRGDPEADIDMHYIHNYENIKKWIDANVDIGYDAFVKWFEDKVQAALLNKTHSG